jgi:hypothetical protein
MKLKVNGFGTFDSNRVVFVDIDASDRLNEFRLELVNAIRPYCRLQPHDKRAEKERFGYHSTLAMNLDHNEFESIKRYIANKPKPQFGQIILRVTLLKRAKILREYDFIQRQLLDRRQALDRRIFRNSIELLQRFMRGEYNPDSRVESAVRRQPRKGLWHRFLHWMGVR